MRSLRALCLLLLAACRAAPHGERVHHHRFERAGEWAARFDDPARDAWQQPDAVVAMLELRPGMTAVDLGAGTGYFTGRLARAVAPAGRVLALDVEPDMVRHLAARAGREGWVGVEPRAVAADDPGLDAGSVDRVLVVDTWHHLAGRAAYARRLAAALAPGGAVLVVDFTRESPEGPPAEARLEAEEVAGELRAAGLAAEVVAETLPRQWVVRARRAP